LTARFQRRLHLFLERHLPEKRLFLKSEDGTRFIRLKSSTQAVIALGGSALMAWTIVATAVLLMDFVGSDSLRAQSERERQNYETRLNALSAERNARAQEAQTALERFYVALAQISEQQSMLLASEDRRRELETGIEVIQKTLRRTMKDRDAAQERAALLTAELEAVTGATTTQAGRQQDIEATLDVLAEALAETAGERDGVRAEVAELESRVGEMLHEARLKEERTNRIFARLEEAVTVSLDPLDQIFGKAGISTDKLIQDVRSGYTGQGGPLMPLSFSTKGTPPSPEEARANALLGELDRINLYRMAADRVPLAMPLKASFRFTSGFGGRKDPKTGGYRAHTGVDMAGAYGTAIYATADGVVTHADWQSGYGRLVTVRHAMGFETRYAHLSGIDVKVGQRISRGDRIGAMGNSGRSTGTHLHYEVRVGGDAVNPMTYIRAARDVF
jgi:murein DD-endopeptidase MepM/ murein hydrolase activator NlpD